MQESLSDVPQYGLPLIQPGGESLAERGLREGFTPLVPGYNGEDRNADARDETVNGTMGWSQKGADAVITHAPEQAAAVEALPTEVSEGRVALTGAERARQLLVAKGIAATPVHRRKLATGERHFDAYAGRKE